MDYTHFAYFYLMFNSLHIIVFPGFLYDLSILKRWPNQSYQPIWTRRLTSIIIEAKLQLLQFTIHLLSTVHLFKIKMTKYRNFVIFYYAPGIYSFNFFPIIRYDNTFLNLPHLTVHFCVKQVFIVKMKLNYSSSCYITFKFGIM